MVISSSGLVLTNNHVINGTTGLTARVVATGRRYKATFLGYDKADDVAVLQLQHASGLRTIPIGNSAQVKLGDGVVALGNAGGSGQTTTVTGSITGLHQTITASDDGSSTSEKLTDMLRTNADIVPGDSGGPLASTDGKVIGMDTAAATGSFGTGQQDVGFAIPINRAMKIANQIIHGQASGSVTLGSSGFLGVLVPDGKASQAADPAEQRRLQIQSEQSGSSGGLGIPRAGSQCVPNSLDVGIPAKVAPVSSGALILGDLCGTPSATAGHHRRGCHHLGQRPCGQHAHLADRHHAGLPARRQDQRHLVQAVRQEGHQDPDAGREAAAVETGAGPARSRDRHQAAPAPLSAAAAIRGFSAGPGAGARPAALARPGRTRRPERRP